MTMTPTDASERERLVASLLDSALEKANDYDCESNVFDEEKAADMLRADAEKIRALEADRDLAEKGRLIVTRELVRLLDYIEEMDARQSNSNSNAMWIDARSYYGLKGEAITARSNAFEQQLNNALAATQSPRSEAGEGKK